MKTIVENQGFTTVVLLVSILAAISSNAAAVSGQFVSGDNFTESFNVSPQEVRARVSVNQFGYNFANVTAEYVDNSSSTRTFKVKSKGNFTGLASVPDSFTLFNNESDSFPVILNVPRTQSFGWYNGSVSLTSQKNGNFTEELNLSVYVYDNIHPVFESSTVGDVMATENVSWSVSVDDNLNVTKVTGKVFQVVERVQGNTTVKVNETFINKAEFSKNVAGGGVTPSFTYTFSDTDEIGVYWVNLTAEDSSGNTVSKVEKFSVNGLESIHVTEPNFVFDTIRPKQQTRTEFLRSELAGKKFKVSLEDLSFGGNESVKLGVVPPESNAPEILAENGGNRTYQKKGVYSLVLIHTGDNETRGVHQVTGSVKVWKPGQHVKPRVESVSFSGSVKNLNKPPEMCTRIAEFRSCIGYSLKSVQKLYRENFEQLTTSNGTGKVFMISTLPVTQVEGSREWQDTTSLTMGEYNQSLTKARNARDEAINTARFWKDIGKLSFVMFLLVSGTIYRMRQTEGTFVISYKVPKERVEKRG